MDILRLYPIPVGNRPGGVKNSTGNFVPYPTVMEEFLTYLTKLRQSSVALTCITIRGLLIGHLQHHIPQIFTMPSRDGTLLRCSEIFVRRYVDRALGWTIRRSTRAGRKIPQNADEISRKAFLRMAYVVKHEDVPPELIANSDQTRLMLSQGCSLTYAEKGSSQVTTVGSDEKRAITILVTLTNDGILLPFQAIHKGMTDGLLPSKNARSMDEALAANFLFESSFTKTYWSTQATMRNFVNTTLAPHFDAVKVRLCLSPQQASLWLIDCWSVHRSNEFMAWIKVTHRTIIVLFVPAGMTGLLQPCDVGFQRIFKHSLKLSAHDDVVQEVLLQLKQGVPVSDIKIDTTLKTLRNRTIHWTWVAFKALNKPDVIKKAWKMCQAGQFNFSYESLTSRGARQALRDLPTSDPVFFTEISQPRFQASPPDLTPDEMATEDAEDDVDSPGDHSDVPLSELIAFRDETKTPFTDSDFGAEIYVPGEDGGLLSTADAESTSLEAIEDHIIDITPPEPAGGRPRRTKRANVLYSSKWWKDHTNDPTIDPLDS